MNVHRSPSALTALAWLLLCGVRGVGQCKGIEAHKNGQRIQQNGTIFALASDDVVLKPTCPKADFLGWYKLEPIQKTYEISQSINGGFLPIEVEYRFSRIASSGSANQLILASPSGLKPGTTFYFAATIENAEKLDPRRLQTLKCAGSPIAVLGTEGIEVVVRQDDSYTGYLSELFNVPFGLMPLFVSGKHQTDARVLIDCAEFAIYGKRRQGYDVDYVGPKRIFRYLSQASKNDLVPKPASNNIIYLDADTLEPFSLKANDIKEGDIVHFGDQVAVFVQDNGLKDILDADDLILYSYNSPPRLAAIGNTEFSTRRLRVYRWKLT